MANADVRKAAVSTADGSQPVAVKEPHVSGTISTEVIEQLLFEAKLWSDLDEHEHIVTVMNYEANPCRGSPWSTWTAGR